MNLNEYHDLIIEEFCYKNNDDRSISKIIGVSDSSVRRYRHANKIINLYKDDNWLTERFNEGLSSVAAASLINVSPSTISRAWIKLGLREKEHKNSLTINDNFFSEYNSESCYWAGFICADGHIEAWNMHGRSTPNYKLKIILSEKDRCHLELFANSIGEDIPIKKRNVTLNNGKTYPQIELKISRKQICLDLMDKFEIAHTNKSMKEFISDKIPAEFLPDFVRGCIDGDGWVKGTSNAIGLCGSYELCSQVSKIFYDKLGINEYEPRRDGKSDLFRIEYYSKANLTSIYKYLYKDNSIFLHRKHDRFLEIISR